MSNHKPYQPKVIEHFKNPHNFGKIEDPDGVGKVGNIVCGDVMWVYIRVGKNKQGEETLKDVRFETFGCVAAVATSSMVTDLAKGKTLKEALGIDKKEIADSLGGLPPVKMHCSVLAVDALGEAIYNYLSENDKEIPKELEVKHQRVKKELEEIKERYQDSAGAGEEVREEE